MMGPVERAAQGRLCNPAPPPYPGAGSRMTLVPFVHAAIASCVLVAACSGDGGSAPLRGAGGTGTQGTPGIDVDPDAGRDTCGLPASTAVCECAELPFADVPTLWFVLDRSASMAADGKWQQLRSVVLDVVLRLGPRIRVATSLYPRAGQSDQCARGRIALEPRDGDRPAGSRGATWHALQQVLAASDPEGGTPLSATLEVVGEAIASRNDDGRHVVVLTTDGAPNCNEAAGCDASRCVPNIEGVEGCPVGGPPNCCDPEIGTALNCLDDAAAHRAVQALAQRGVSTYVLGAPGSEPYQELLEALASAGGTARTTRPGYYAVTTSDTAAFAQALSSIAATILATCSIALERAPADPAMVNVVIDGAAIGPGAQTGWTLDGATVTLHGSACDRVLSGQALDVRVVVGCPTVTVN